VTSVQDSVYTLARKEGSNRRGERADRFEPIVHAVALTGSNIKASAHIAGLDSGGVALAAIQGLNLKLQEKQEEVVQLKQRLEALEKKLNAVLAAQPAER
jgi:hypothetical protein